MGRVIEAKGIGAPDFVKELRPTIYTITTDKDTHFTEAIAKNGVERENLVGLRTDRICIKRVTIQADQQLFFEVLFYGTDLFEEADLDDDRFVGSVELNLPIYGFTQTEAQYRLDIDNLNIDYEDKDKTKELHVVLKNLSPTDKNLGATGKVKIEFLVESRA